jgi:hypothetical protein
VAATAKALHKTSAARATKRFVAFIVSFLCGDFIVMRMGRSPAGIIQPPHAIFLANKLNKPPGFAGIAGWPDWLRHTAGQEQGRVSIHHLREALCGLHWRRRFERLKTLTRKRNSCSCARPCK